jgi:lipoprotein-releasing system permease protein
MIFEWKIAFRFLKEGKGQSVFILLGISIGVSVMIFLNTLITGLQENLVNQTVGSSAHVWLTAQSDYEKELSDLEDNILAANGDKGSDNLSNWENLVEVLEERTDITGISPLVNGNAFFIDGTQSASMIINGFDSERADEIYDISNKIIAGSSLYEGNNVLVGSDFYEEYNLSIGDIIQLTLPTGSSQSFVISGVFDLGSGVINSGWIIMELSRAQKFLGFGNDISKIELQVEDVFEAETIGADIDNRFTGVAVNNWIENNSSLLSALTSQSSSSILIQVFVLLAITLGISSVLAVSVVQKSKQLGILKAMGTKSSQASSIFLLQGALLGVIGSALGALLGIAIIEMFLWGTSLATGVPLFPLAVKWDSILVIGFIASLSSTLAAFIPAKRSSKLNPVEVIRNG